MKKIIAKICGALAGLSFLSAYVGGFIAYAMISVDTKTGIIYDGFGRAFAQEAPWIIHLIGREKHWTGFGWLLVDVVVFFGLHAAAYYLFMAYCSLADQRSLERSTPVTSTL